jgi:ferrochelatase
MLMAHGGPDSLEDIEPFLGHIIKGRIPSPEIIATVKDRYRQIGGKSPLLEITRKQAEALEVALNSKANSFRVYVGMRHWTPYIKETLSQILNDKPSRLIAISMAPQHSRLSVGAYIEAARTGLSALGAENLPVSFVSSWHTQPLLLDAFAKKVKKRLLEYPEAIRQIVRVVFTAHSLPETILAEGDLYPIHLQETMTGIVKRLGALLPAENVKFAYQSRGMSGGKWLGPDMEEVLGGATAPGEMDAPAAGVPVVGRVENKQDSKRYILMVPIGFVADHVEILYDIDILYKQMAKERGIVLDRTESLNDSPLFISALASVVHAHLPF